MVRPPGHRRFLSLAERFEGTDADLAARLGTSRSMLSRVKAGKVQKIAVYLNRLEAIVGGASPLEEVLRDLGRWSADSPELRGMLVSLHRIAQESAEP